MTYGLILSAGLQKRFNSDIPKALSMIHGKCLLDINIENMKKYCDSIYVVCSFDNYTYFTGTDYKKIIIDSGKGCGDAILKALYCIQPKLHDKCFIQYSDSLQNPSIYSDLINFYTEKFIIPCIKVNNPDIQIKNENNHIVALFSEYNEHIEPGYKDLSIFYGDATILYNKLVQLTKSCLKDGIYQHKHGNELHFLDVFNDTDIEGEIMEVNYDSVSFNTLEELEKLNGS